MKSDRGRRRNYYHKSEEKQERHELRKLKDKIKELEKINRRLINEIKQVNNALDKTLARIKELENRSLEDILEDLHAKT